MTEKRDVPDLKAAGNLFAKDVNDFLTNGQMPPNVIIKSDDPEPPPPSENSETVGEVAEPPPATPAVEANPQPAPPQATPEAAPPSAPEVSGAAPAAPSPISMEQYVELVQKQAHTEAQLKMLQQQAQKDEPKPEPEDLYQKYMGDFREPDLSGVDEDLYGQAYLQAALGHIAGRMREDLGKELGDVGQLREQLQSATAYIQAQQQKQAQDQWEGVLSKGLDDGGFKADEKRYGHAKQWVDMAMRNAFATGQGRQWTEAQWGAYLKQQVQTAAGMFPAPPSGTPKLEVVEEPGAPVGPASGSGSGPELPRRDVKTPSSAQELNSNFAAAFDSLMTKKG